MRKPILVLLLSVAFTLSAWAQTTYYSQTSTDLQLASNWNSLPNGLGTAPSNFTTANQVFMIDDELAASISAAWTVSGSNSKIVVGDGVNAVVFSSGANAITGIVDVAAAATFNYAATTSPFTLGTCSSGSTVSYSGDLVQSVKAGSYHHLTLTNATVTRLKTANGAISVSGNLTVDNLNILTMGNNVLSGAFTTTFGTGTITTTNTTATPLPSGVTWSQTVQYNGGTSHVLPNGVYENLTIGGGSDTKTANGNIIVNGILEVVSTNTLALTTFTLTGGFITAGTGTITTTNTTSTPIPSGKTWTMGVYYTALGTQTIMDATYANLTISGSGVKPAQGDIIVNGILNVVSTATFNMGTFMLSGALTSIGTGTIQTANTSATPIPAGKTWIQSIRYNSSSSQTVVPGYYSFGLNTSGGNRVYSSADTIGVGGTWTTGAGTLDFTGTSIALRGTAVTITITGQSALVFNNLSVSATGLKTFSNVGGTITINGNLNIPGTNALYSLVLGNNKLVLGGGHTLTGQGTLATACILANPIPSIVGSWPYILNYNSSVNQFVSAGSYRGLAISGSGISTAEGNITVTDTLAVTLGTFAMATFVLDGTMTDGIGGSTAGIFSITNTTGSPIPAGKVWPMIVLYPAVANQTIVGGTYNGGLQVLGGGSSIKTASGNIAVGATITVATATILEMGSFSLDATTVANSGTIRTQNTSLAPLPAGKTYGGVVEYNGVGIQTVVNGSYTSLNLTGGDRTLSNTDTIKISTTFTMGAGTYTSAGSIVALNGASSQSILAGGQTLDNLSIISGTTKTVTGGNINVNDVLHIASAAILVMGTFDLGGTMTTANGSGTILTTSVSVSPIPASVTWPYTVIFASTVSNQTVPAGTYTDLILSAGASRVITASGAIDVTGVLNVGSTTLFDMTTFKLSGTASLTGTGTIRTQETSATPLPAGKIWTQNVLYNSTSAQTVVDGEYNLGLNVAGGDRTFSNANTISVGGTFTANTEAAVYTTTGSTLIFTASTAQTITLAENFPFDNVSFIGGGTKTTTVAYSVATSMNIASGVSVSVGTGALTGAFTTSGTGTLRTQNTTTTPIPTAKTWTFRVQFDANANQTVPVGVYSGGLYAVAISSVFNKTLAGSITVGDTLSVATTFATLVLNGNALTLNGVINPAETGTITGSATSSITIGPNANDAGTLNMTQTSTATRSLDNLTLSRATGADALILGNEVRLIGVLSLTDGTLASNGNLVFISSGVATSAQVDEVTGTGNVSGNVVVQRFMEGQPIATNVRWRFLASSVTTSNGIDDNWQQQMYITGAGTGGTMCPTITPNDNGFDPTSTNASSFYTRDYTSDTWTALPNTNATELQTGIGYRVFYRGSRSQNCATVFTGGAPDPSDTTLVATGTLAIGSQPLTGASVASRYALVGNPFQATIDWESPSISLSNLSNTISTLRPNSVNGSYAYYTIGVGGTNGMTQYMSPGTSFWIQTAAAGASGVTVGEGSKVVTQGGFAFFKTAQTDSEVLRVKLSITGNSNMLDEAIVAIRPNTSWDYAVTEEAAKLGFGTNQLQLEVPSEVKKMAICVVPEFDATHNRVNLDAKTVIGTNYTFDFSGMTSFDANLGFTLHDTYTSTSQDLRSNAIYNFTTPDTASTLSTRFYIIFDPNANPLPVKLTSFAAQAITPNDVALTWQTASEQHSDRFEVERSADGKTFAPIGEVAAARYSNKPKNYTLTDANINVTGTVFYRLKQVDLGGSFSYSKVVSVDLGQKAKGLNTTDVALYPVPAEQALMIEVKNTSVLNNPEIKFYDMFGKEIVLPLTYEAGKWTVQTEELKSGIYLVTIFNQGESTQLRFVKR